MMAERWATVFHELSDRRERMKAQALTVQRGSTISQIDGVLTGDIAVQELTSSLAGLKETSSQRLHLRLMSSAGVLLWETELPYTVVSGAKNLDEAMVTNALLAQVRMQEHELGLTELGTIAVTVQNVEGSLP